MLGYLVVCMSRKHNWYAYALMGTVDRCGYCGLQKCTICDARGPYPSIWHTLKPFFVEFDWFVVIASRLSAYISRYGDFCANNNDNNNDNDDTTDYFTPLRMCAGNYVRICQLCAYQYNLCMDYHPRSKKADWHQTPYQLQHPDCRSNTHLQW